MHNMMAHSTQLLYRLFQKIWVDLDYSPFSNNIENLISPCKRPFCFLSLGYFNFSIALVLLVVFGIFCANIEGPRAPSYSSFPNKTEPALIHQFSVEFQRIWVHYRKRHSLFYPTGIFCIFWKQYFVSNFGFGVVRSLMPAQQSKTTFSVVKLIECHFLFNYKLNHVEEPHFYVHWVIFNYFKLQ